MENIKVVYPDYSNCSLNMTSAILNHYGLKCEYAPSQELLEELSKDYETVVLMILDGMGTYIMKDNLKEDNFIKDYKVKDMTSVYPSSTVPSTTSILTGKSPNETGWLGWQQYFAKYNRNIVMFMGNDFYKNEDVKGFNAKEELPTKELCELLSDKVKTYEIYPSFRKGGVKTFKEMTNRILKYGNEEGKKFIYAYYDEPDHSMHHYGSRSDQVKKLLSIMDSKLRRLYRRMNDKTLIIISADHGQRDVKYFRLNDYKDFMDTLERLPSNEGRAAALKIKSGKKEQFLEQFNLHFKDYFKLYSKEELKNSKLLGLGKSNSRLDEFIDDYFMVSISDYNIYYDTGDIDFLLIGHHGGLTIDEMMVPMILLHK